jgi:tetratricopeptide (TPR) repeat protein
VDEYDYFRNRKDSFQPKTPIAALKAYKAGFLPISVFTYKSGSTKPLDETPYDIEEIERLLSRKNLGLETNIVLIDIFEDLIFSEDQEIALFAAESINIIENRYNKRIEDYKYAEDSLEVSSKLGRLFFELALLNRKRDSIKKFFLRESYQYYSAIRKTRKLLPEELNTIIRILLELKLYLNAFDIIEKEKTEESIAYLFLKAEILFAIGKYREVRDICRKIQDFSDTLNDKEQMTIDYWLGV